MTLAKGDTVYPNGSLFVDCQAMEMNHLVKCDTSTAARCVECTGQTITPRLTTTVPLDPWVWNGIYTYDVLIASVIPPLVNTYKYVRPPSDILAQTMTNLYRTGQFWQCYSLRKVLPGVATP